MKSIKIISNKTMRQYIAVLVILVVYATIQTIINNGGKDISLILQAVFSVIIIMAAVVLGMHLAAFRGKFLEISNEGLDLGKRYQGPYSTSSQVNAYAIPRRRKENLFIPWSHIARVSFGTWERFWARHWNIFTPLLSGDINDSSQSQKIAQVFGIPAMKMRGFYLIIHTKKNEFYAFDLNKTLAQQTESAIRKYGYGNLIDALPQKL